MSSRIHDWRRVAYHDPFLTEFVDEHKEIWALVIDDGVLMLRIVHNVVNEDSNLVNCRLTLHKDISPGTTDLVPLPIHLLHALDFLGYTYPDQHVKGWHTEPRCRNDGHKWVAIEEIPF